MAGGRGEASQFGTPSRNLTIGPNVISMGFFPLMPSSLFRHSAMVFLAGAAALWCRGATELTPSSPFMLPGNGGADANASAAASPVELHGIVDTADGYKFDLYDPVNHKDTWVGFNEKGKPYVVHSHDIAHNRVTVEYQGHEYTLTLPQPKISPMTGVSALPMPVMRSPVMVGQPPVMGAPNAEQERLRIERITEEIRRRRALRAAQERQQQMQGGGFRPGSVPQSRNY